MQRRVVNGYWLTMFLKIDGIDGESQDDKHKDEIQIQSFSFGASNAGSGGVGTGSGSGKVSVQRHASSPNTVDKASPQSVHRLLHRQDTSRRATSLCRKAGGKPQSNISSTS